MMIEMSGISLGQVRETYRIIGGKNVDPTTQI